MNQTHTPDQCFRPVVLSCRTLELELSEAMRRAECQYPVIWLEAGLHNVPARLHAALEQALAQCACYSHVLVAMGFCGNALIGLNTRHLQLVVPRVDDCISLLLGSMQRRLSLNSEGLYYFTEGWLKGERTLLAEYRHAAEKYGEKRAQRVLSAMLHNYRKAAAIETGCGADAWTKQQTKAAACELGLSYCELHGTLDYLLDLLTGNWPAERFLCFPPQTQITQLPLGL